MDMVSAITAMIARNNGIDPDILWASESEYAQMDVYYHEAITALETKLAKQVSPSAKFVYFQEGTDYSLVVDLSPRWNTKLKPLVINRLQEYLVHTILHKWIAGFPGDIVAINYADTAASDLPILVSLLQRVTFSQQEGDRVSIDDELDNYTVKTQTDERIQDTDEQREVFRSDKSVRTADEIKLSDCIVTSKKERSSDKDTIVTYDSSSSSRRSQDSEVIVVSRSLSNSKRNTNDEDIAYDGNASKTDARKYDASSLVDDDTEGIGSVSKRHNDIGRVMTDYIHADHKFKH